MYLEGLLGDNFAKGIDLISEKFSELSETDSDENSATQKRLTRYEKEFNDLYSRLNQISNSSDSKIKAFLLSSNDIELSDKETTELKKQTKNLVRRKMFSGDVPEYLYKLLFKLKSKIIWNIDERLTDDSDLYSEYSAKDIEIMCEFKSMLEEYLQKSEKIFFYHELSRESINNLVRICLELIL
jgi:hypothetical protein